MNPIVIGTQSVIIWISAIVLLSFGFTLYLGSKERAARVYSWVAFWTAAWALSMGFYYLSTDPEWLTFWNINNHFVIGVTATSFFYFSLIFGEWKLPYTRIVAVLSLFELVRGILYFGTDLLIDKTYPPGGAELVNRAFLFNQVGLKFYIPFFVFFILGYCVLLAIIQKTNDQKLKTRITYILYSAIVGIIPAVSFTIFIPKLTESLELYWLGPIAALVWVSLTTYSIVKYGILSVRLIFTEISVFAMSGILFANVFIDELAFGTLTRLMIFLAFATVGGFFIRNIVKNEQQREELAKLTTELKDLNENLQVRVDERTRELKNAKAHSETVIENLTSGLIEYDNDFTVLRINKAAERLLGVPRGDVVGVQVLPHDRDREGWESLVSVSYPSVSDNERKVAPAVSGLAASVNEVTVHYPLERNLQVVTAPLVEDGGATRGFIKLIRDVTRERLIARSKSEFITIAAHQLRTPLSIVKWSLSVLLDHDMGTLAPRQEETLRKAQTTNDKMIGLVNDLLDVTRIEDGRFGYEFKEGDLVALLHGITAEYSTLSGEKHITFTFQKPRTPFPRFVFDASRLSLAFHGLLDNAFRYTKEGGSITVSMKVEGNLAAVTVEDSGIGIPRRQQDRLFTKFFRAENAVRVAPSGSGLGLFIVKNIVARHGGRVRVTSQEGVGTAMTLELPLDKKAIPETDETV